MPGQRYATIPLSHAETVWLVEVELATGMVLRQWPPRDTESEAWQQAMSIASAYEDSNVDVTGIDIIEVRNVKRQTVVTVAVIDGPPRGVYR